MNTRLLQHRYPTYLLHERAVNTVARFAGLQVHDVAGELDARMRKRQQRVYENTRLATNPLYRSYRRALDTVAKFAGLDINSVLSGFERNGPQHVESPEQMEKKAA